MPFPIFAPRRPQPAGVTAVAGSKGPSPELTVSKPSTHPGHSYAREAAALLLLASALFVALALASFSGDPLRDEVAGWNWVGPVGAEFARSMVGAIGVTAWVLPIELGLLAAPLLNNRPSTASVTRIAGDVVVVFILSALADVACPRVVAFGSMPVGGSVGELFGEILRTLFSTVGSYLIGLTVVGLILVGRATFSFIECVKRVERWIVALVARLSAAARVLASAWAAARHIEQKSQTAKAVTLPRITRDGADEAVIAALTTPDDDEDTRKSLELVLAPSATPLEDPLAPDTLRSMREAVGQAPEPAPVQGPEDRPAAPATIATPRAPVARRDTASDPSPRATADDKESASGTRSTDTPAPTADLRPAPEEKRPAPPRAEPQPLTGFKIVDTTDALNVVKADKPHVVPAIGQGFRLPSFEMLHPAESDRPPVDEQVLTEMAQQLEKTLSDYGVSGKVEEIHPGPTVTTFEVSPAAGTKVSKVAGLADDLALGLSRKVRIVAPIPGKNRIGFEIPNAERVAVNLRELVEDKRFQEMKVPLPCVLGRDIIGAPYFADLSSMPHVIVAGATGAGKSVGLNVMLVSLLFRKTPAELRLLMIDPKVVELAPFDRIPHMLLPVVTDMKQAANALKWAVDEMERRYQLFANAGTKNISTYNAWVGRVLRGEARPPRPPSRLTAVGADGAPVSVEPARDGSDQVPPEKLPFIVIVVDEFADLMMQQGKDVETSVARLAQKARAAGMHVILATQRPSVDVITGMIKANFPTRIAFRVAQKVDSRTILDEQGAEHLLGRGDMLVKMNGSTETRRVQCPFCSEEEVQAITDFLRLQGEPEYDEAILKARDEADPEEDVAEAENDPMYDAAVRIVADTRRCSTSWIQRKLGVGYNRAAKIVEAMEKRGIVGPANGSKDREVLIGAL